MRNWERDDPVRDAEEWANSEDERPLVGHCEVCDAPLHSSSPGWDPDDGYEIEDNVFVCADCLHEYFKERRIR